MFYNKTYRLFNLSRYHYEVKKLHAVLSAFLVVCSFQAFAVTDAELTAQVKKQIHANKTTANSKIDVTTKKGTVFLSGNLNTESEASSAIETANSIAGVKKVDSDELLVNNSSQPYKDSYITAKVKGAFIQEKLFGDKPVDVTGINVETKDGVVYLTGTAATKAQADSAKSIAKTIEGVKGVESSVVVKPKE